MHRFPSLLALLVFDLDQAAKASVAREQDSALFESFPDCGEAVSGTVLVPLRAISRWCIAVVERGEVATREDVGGRKGRRCSDAM